MNKYDFISFNALLVLIIALPIYAAFDPIRMEQAQQKTRRQLLLEGSEIYVQNCAYCHGANGEGAGSMPSLNHPGLIEADYDMIYKTIAHSPHGSKMATWHIDEGGILNDYQVDSLVTLIKYGDWVEVSELAIHRGFETPPLVAADNEFAMLEPGDEADPHECRSCHEEPDVHANRFGLNCARCHTLVAWKPALLTRHTFELDHGNEGNVACETCHTETYADHTCYECHDHQPEHMKQVHAEQQIYEIADCAQCHPTGRPGEAGQYTNSQAGLTSWHAGE
jgi:mono/diheme cytochrome c family protein